MPSEPQLTLIHTVPVTEESLGSSHTARLRRSYSSHINSVVSVNPDASYHTGQGDLTRTVQLHGDLDAELSLKKFYGKYVMRGIKNPPGAGFPAEGFNDLGGGVNLSYRGSPQLGPHTSNVPEGEAMRGAIGSSIDISGLGPNVNIHGTLGEGGDRQPVSAKPSSTPPFVGNGSKAPSQSQVYEIDSSPEGASGVIPAGSMGKSQETVTG